MKLGFPPVSKSRCGAEDEGEYRCERHEQETVKMVRGKEYPLCRIEKRIVHWIRIEDAK